MAWYDIPRVKATYVFNDDGEKRGIIFSAIDFEKLVQKLENFHDFKAVEAVKKRKEPTYTLEQVVKQLGLED
jgi:hypothetical protein